MAVIDFISPNTWTDQDMTWSNPSTRKARYAEAIRCALLERAEEVDASVAATLSAFQVVPYQLLDYSLLKTLHDAALDIAPSFANHTAIDGDRSFEEIPDWTVDDIMATLNRKVLIEPMQYALNLDDWFEMMHDFISLLLYTSEEVNEAAEEESESGGTVQYGFAVQTRSSGANETSSGHGTSGSFSWSTTDGTESETYEIDSISGESTASHCEGGFSSASWSTLAWGSGVSSSASCTFSATESGNSGVQTSSSWSASKSQGRIYFRLTNNSEYTTPEVEVELVVYEDDEEISRSAYTIPDAEPGTDYKELIYTMPQIACQPEKSSSRYRAYSFELPGGTEPENVDDSTFYRLVSHDLKFK